MLSVWGFVFNFRRTEKTASIKSGQKFLKPMLIPEKEEKRQINFTAIIIKVFHISSLNFRTNRSVKVRKSNINLDQLN